MRLVLKAEQLAFAFSQRKEVQKPGSKGGKFYRTRKSGKVKYGVYPDPEAAPTPKCATCGKPYPGRRQGWPNCPACDGGIPRAAAEIAAGAAKPLSGLSPDERRELERETRSKTLPDGSRVRVLPPGRLLPGKPTPPKPMPPYLPKEKPERAASWVPGAGKDKPAPMTITREWLDKVAVRQRPFAEALAKWRKLDGDHEAERNALNAEFEIAIRTAWTAKMGKKKIPTMRGFDPPRIDHPKVSKALPGYTELRAGFEDRAKKIGDAQDEERKREDAHLSQLADDYPLLPIPGARTLFYHTYPNHTQTSVEHYSKGDAQRHADDAEWHGVAAEIVPDYADGYGTGRRTTFMGHAVYVNLDETGVEALKRKEGVPFREMIRRQLKRGINLRVDMPMLPYGYEASIGLDAFGNIVDQAKFDADGRGSGTPKVSEPGPPPGMLTVKLGPAAIARLTDYVADEGNRPHLTRVKFGSRAVHGSREDLLALAEDLEMALDDDHEGNIRGAANYDLSDAQVGFAVGQIETSLRRGIEALRTVAGGGTQKRYGSGLSASTRARIATARRIRRARGKA